MPLANAPLETKEILMWRRDHHFIQVEGAPEPVCVEDMSAVFGHSGRHYPFPGNWDLYTNPRGPSFGQVAQGDVLQVVLRYFIGTAINQFASTVHHFIAQKVGTGRTFEQTATALIAAIVKAFTAPTGGDGLQAAYGAQYSMKNSLVRSLKDSSDQVVIAGGWAGKRAQSTGAVPLRVAPVVHKGTAKRGKSFAGRVFMPSVDETEQVRGALADSYTQASNRTWGQTVTLTGTGDDAGYELVQGVYSPTKSDGQPAPVVTPINSITTRGVTGSQRRRQHVL